MFLCKISRLTFKSCHKVASNWGPNIDTINVLGDKLFYDQNIQNNTLIAAPKAESAVLLFWNMLGMLSSNSSRCWRHWNLKQTVNFSIITSLSLFEEQNNQLKSFSKYCCTLGSISLFQCSPQIFRKLGPQNFAAPTSESWTITSVWRGV